MIGSSVLGSPRHTLIRRGGNLLGSVVIAVVVLASDL